MKTITVIPITTDRLTLRPFRLEDAEAMYSNWASDPDVTRYLTWGTHPDVDATRGCINFWLTTADPTWCIALKDTDMPIGSISVVNVEGETAEVGYCISKAYWGKGIVAEAFKALIQVLFDGFDVKEITAKHDLNNPNSGKVMQKSGLTFVRTIEKGVTNNQGLCDVAVYAIRSNKL